MLNENTELLLILAGVMAAVLLQAGVLLGIYLTVRKAVQTGKEQAEEYRAKLVSIIDGSGQLISTANGLVEAMQSLIKAIRPQLESAATELANMTQDIHAQASQLQSSVDEVALKARLQVNRVDGMATNVLNGLDRFGRFLNEAVNVPIRQVNGIVAAAKAVVDTLRAPAPPRPRSRSARDPIPVAEDKDLFV